jgi:hypothetical protein
MNKQHLRWFLTLKATEEGNEKGSHYEQVHALMANYLNTEQR